MNKKQAKQKLGPLLKVVKAHRKFISAVLYNWMKDNRGIPAFGGEIGMGSRGGKAHTTLNGKKISFSKLYSVLKRRSNWNNPKYDTARAAALATFLKRDFVHVTNSAVKALASGLGSFGSSNYVHLGAASPDVAPPTTPQGAKAAAQADVPAEDIDWGKLLADVVMFLPNLISFLGTMMAEEDATQSEAAPAATQSLTLPTSLTFGRQFSVSTGKPSYASQQPSQRERELERELERERERGQAVASSGLPILPIALGVAALVFVLSKR